MTVVREALLKLQDVTFTVDSRPSASSKNDGETSILWSFWETALSSFYKRIGMWDNMAI